MVGLRSSHPQSLRNVDVNVDKLQETCTRSVHGDLRAVCLLRGCCREARAGDAIAKQSSNSPAWEVQTREHPFGSHIFRSTAL